MGDTVKLGLTPARTGRAIASVIALLGMLMLLIQRVLSAVLVMAKEGVGLGLTRYNNFTGRFAAQNFAEDKKLLHLLKDVQDLLPTAESALTVLLVFSIIFLAVALIGLAFPKQFVHILVALKILKWETGEPESLQDKASPREVLETIGNVPLKKIAAPVGIVLAIVIVCLGIATSKGKVEASSIEGSIDDMQQKALSYIEAQKKYFAKTKNIGNASALQMTDSLSTDAFDIQVTATRFSAVSKVPLADCPAGSRWQVSSSTKGLFSVELQLYRGTPKDSNCVKLTPDFKKLGKNAN